MILQKSHVLGKSPSQVIYKNAHFYVLISQKLFELFPDCIFFEILISQKTV